MAESFIVRRGGSGGNISGLAVYTGDSLPSDKEYGIWANTTNQVNNIIIESPVGTAFSLDTFTFASNTSSGAGCITPDETKFIKAGGSLYTNVDTRITIYDMSSQTTSSVDTGLNRTSSVNGTFVLPGMENSCYMITSGFYSSGNDYYTDGVAYRVDFSTQTSTTLNSSGPISSDMYLIDAWNDVLVYQHRYRTASNGYLYWYITGFSTPSNVFTTYVFSRWGASSSSASAHMYLLPMSVNGKEWYYLDTSYNNALYYADISAGSLSSGITYDYPGGVSVGFYWDGYIYIGNTSYISRALATEAPTSPETLYTGTFRANAAGTNIPAVAYRGQNSVYWCGGTNIYKFNLIDIEYPNNSLVIRVSKDGYVNLATIIYDDNMEVTIPVESIQYYDGSELTELSGSVRTYGGEWTAIE